MTKTKKKLAVGCWEDDWDCLDISRGWKVRKHQKWYWSGMARAGGDIKRQGTVDG